MAQSIEAVLPTVYPWARSRAQMLTGSVDAAEDLVQDAMIACLRRPPEPPTEEALRAWFTTVLFRMHLRRRRRLATEARALLRFRDPAVTSLPEPAGDVVRALASLPPRQRACAVLFYVEDLPEADIAAMLRIRPGTVKAHLAQARSNLRANLAKEATSDAEMVNDLR